MQVESFEEQSISNMFYFYEKELRKILKGTQAASVLTRKERRTLRKFDVLDYRRGKWSLTEKARQMLRE
jgi:hypothetical protein